MQVGSEDAAVASCKFRVVAVVCVAVSFRFGHLMAVNEAASGTKLLHCLSPIKYADGK